MGISISLNDSLEVGEVIDLYRSNGWSSADKPDELMAALRNSHTLVTARLDGNLVGVANAISDGSLVVYFPHMLVSPAHQRSGTDRKMVSVLLEKYRGFHQLMLTADEGAVRFYESIGFMRAGNTTPMWIYEGSEH